MSDTVRTFIAVETDEGVRRRALELIERLRASGADVKWVAPQNMHLTLKFLDEVPLRDIPGVSAAVEQAVASATPFELEIRGAGAFPHPGRPQTLWLGAGSGADRLAALFSDLEKGLAKLGFRRESRRFEPHLTIGRVRQRGPTPSELVRLLKQHAEFEAGSFRVAEFVVFSSELGPKGPTYTALSRARLGQ